MSGAADILSAANRGDLDAVRALAEAHPELVNVHDDTGRTPLYLATTNGHGAVASFLMGQGKARWIPIASFGSAARSKRTSKPSAPGISNRVERSKQMFKRALGAAAPRVSTRAHAIAQRNRQLAANALASARRNAPLIDEMLSDTHSNNNNNNNNNNNSNNNNSNNTNNNTISVKDGRNDGDEVEAVVRTADANNNDDNGGCETLRGSEPPRPVRPPRPSNWDIVRNAPRARGSPRASVKSTTGFGAGKRSARRAQRERAPRSLAIDMKVARGDGATAYANSVEAISFRVFLSALEDSDAESGGCVRDQGQGGQCLDNPPPSTSALDEEESGEDDLAAGEAAAALAGAMGDGVDGDGVDGDGDDGAVDANDGEWVEVPPAGQQDEDWEMIQ